MDNFKRLFVAGKVPTYEGDISKPSLWIEINFTDGKLSITGVHGPLGNGDCRGSCGQCIDTLRELTKVPYAFDIAIGREAAIQLAEVWERWHLNDMRPYCEHMKRDHGWDTLKPLTLYHWTLTTEAWQARSNIKRDAMAGLQGGESVSLSAESQALMALPMEICNGSEEPPSSHYRLKEKETKTAGWVYPADGERSPTQMYSQHPEGLLTKACPTCGYKYGSKWLREEVPQDVLEFLASLPHTPAGYPWGRK